MAISGDSPVSAANLKAVVDKLMGGGLFPEVIFTTNTGVELTSEAIMVPKACGEFREYAVFVTRSTKLAEDCYEARIPASPGDYYLANYGVPGYLGGVTLSVTDDYYSWAIRSNTSRVYVMRVVGYR